jgi:hypothetical protein
MDLKEKSEMAYPEVVGQKETTTVEEVYEGS